MAELIQAKSPVNPGFLLYEALVTTYTPRIAALG
jgi:hypothetical protein